MVFISWRIESGNWDVGGGCDGLLDCVCSNDGFDCCGDIIGGGFGVDGVDVGEVVGGVDIDGGVFCCGKIVGGFVNVIGFWCCYVVEVRIVLWELFDLL